MPYATGLDRVKYTFVPEILTELTARATELTCTENAEEEGTMLARVRLYVNSTLEDVVFSTTAPRNVGIGAGAG